MDGRPYGRLQQGGRVGVTTTLFHVGEPVAKRPDSKSRQPFRDGLKEGMVHPCTCPMGEHVEGAGISEAKKQS